MIASPYCLVWFTNEKRLFSTQQQYRAETLVLIWKKFTYERDAIQRKHSGAQLSSWIEYWSAKVGCSKRVRKYYTCICFFFFFQTKCKMGCSVSSFKHKWPRRSGMARIKIKGDSAFERAKLISARESKIGTVGIVVILYDTLGHHFRVSNSAIFSLPTNIANERYRVLKRAKALRQLDP